MTAAETKTAAINIGVVATATAAGESPSSTPASTSHTATSATSTSTFIITAPAQKYGIPVGVVILANKDIYPFKCVCRTALPHVEKIVFREVTPSIDIDIDSGRTRGHQRVHVQTEVAAAIVDGNAQLTVFLRNCGGEFIPGERLPRPKLELHVQVQGQQQKQRQRSSASSSCAPYVPAQSKFTFVELFAGIGGFRLGLTSAGGTCVLASERDKVACRVYRRQFGSEDLVEGDMLDITSEDFPSDGFDLLTAGFPCQPFSRRGLQKGLKDDGHRGQMYQELCRILMEQRPPYFLFENVVGLVTMDGGSASRVGDERVFKPGRVMERILGAFRDCGYKVQWRVINSRSFVPQYRERVYFVGSLEELEFPDMNWDNIYPPKDDDNKPMVLRDILEKDYATSEAVAQCELTERQWTKLQRIHDGNSTERASFNTDDVSPTLISSYRGSLQSPATKFVMEEADGTLRHGKPLRPRVLSPREFAKIMGFPDHFDVSPPVMKEIGHIYQVLGNAVVPLVIEAVGREMYRHMALVEQNHNRRVKRRLLRGDAGIR